jgi:3-oxoacyl-[acyl-carrier-protein] synthase-3
MNGKEIFKLAVRVMEQASLDVLKKYGYGTNELNLVIPHQANMRIIESLAKRMAIPMGRFHNNLEHYGNTSAATIPIALCEAVEQGVVKPHSQLLTAAFGAGLTWGAGLIRWGERTTPLQQSDAELPATDKTALELLAYAVDQCQNRQA